MREMLAAIWSYRFFIVSSISNDLRVRFLRSKLGALWMVIHPLAQVLIFALVLSEVLAAKLPGIDNKYTYALYLMAGTLGWTLFAETISRCVVLFVDNANLMKKMAFPRICLPIITAGTTLVQNILLLLAIFLVFAALGHLPGIQVLWLPLLMLITLMLSSALGILLGIFNVFVRDVGQVVPVVIQAMFWLTPIVYSLDILPPSSRAWFQLNPLIPLIVSYQNVLVFDKPPEWTSLGWLTVASLIFAGLALVVFRRASAEMVDVL
jgi:ABC-type polysaccharide/polyol phosphate export systems, permease component